MSLGYFEVTGRCRIRVSGTDAQRYLNGQLSNDVRKLQPGQAMRACLLTIKGKLVADPYVWRDDEAFILEAHADLQESLLARLERYIVADDVVLEPLADFSPSYHLIGALKPDALTINRLGIPGCDVSELPSELPRLSHEETERVRILHAMPIWGNELDENVLPAEAGLDTLAVDFHKGCYVGQEVISRIESIGRVKRQLSVLQTRPTLPIGAELFLSETDALVGKVTSSIFEIDGLNGVALAWVHRAHSELGTRLKGALSESDVLTEIKVIEKLP